MLDTVETSAKRVGSVVKAMSVLREFTPQRRVLTVRQIATGTGLPRSTCHALCATLVSESMLEQLPGGGYRLGTELALMGGQVIERLGLVEAASGPMKDLSRRCAGEVHLGQLVGGYVVYLTRIENKRELPMRNRLGLRAPAFLTGCGKAALYCLPEDEVRELVKTASREVDVDPDVEGLLVDLREARLRGYAVSDSFQRNRTSIAAPISGRGGAIVGGISIAQTATSLPPEVIEKRGEAVAAAATEVSAKLQALRGT
jgi:DNA-binding IclR family transcriptional regulator